METPVLRPRAWPRARVPWLLALTLAVAAPALSSLESQAFAQGDKKGKKDDKNKKDKGPDKNADKAPEAAAPPDEAAAPPEDAPADAADAPTSEPPPDEGSDVDALRQEYLRLRDELFRSRARAASVASAMYSTRVRIFLTYGSGRFHAVTRATIRLDGANVFDDASEAIVNDSAVRFEGFVAPGRHVISVRIETTAKDDERFSTVSENSFTIQAPAGKDVIVTAKAKDAGDMAYAWQKKERGSYQPALSVSVKTEKRATPAPGKSATGPAPKAQDPGQRVASEGRRDP